MGGFFCTQTPISARGRLGLPTYHFHTHALSLFSTSDIVLSRGVFLCQVCLFVAELWVKEGRVELVG